MMERKSSNPSDWFFVRMPKSHWDEGPTVFINPKADNGSWDQSAVELQSTVIEPLNSRFGLDADETMECHIELISGGKNKMDALCDALLALGMEERPAKKYFG